MLQNSRVPHVEILLGTYQGENYLEAQLSSIYSQDWPNFSVLAGDDGSTDATVAILELWKRSKQGLTILPAERQGGALANFSRLIQASSAPYVALCDQDDVWDPDKLSLAMTRMQEQEKISPPNTPVLVFSDLRLIDATGRLVSPSLWRKARVHPRGASFENLLAQNLVTGCSALANRALLQKAQQIPSTALMHDYWLALVASAFGVLCPIDRPTVSYRQHAANAIGAGKNLSLTDRIRRIFFDPELAAWTRAAAKQAQAFSECFQSSLSARPTAALNAVVRFPEQSGLQRIRAMLRHGIVRTEFLNELQFLARSAVGSRSIN